MSRFRSSRAVRQSALAIIAAIIVACGGDSKDSTTNPSLKPVAAVAVGPTSGNGIVAGVAPYVPSIKVTDANGNGVRDVLITAQVTFGSGSITTIDPVTDGAGVATVGSWTLGTKKGAQTLTLTAPGLPAIVYTVTAKGYDVQVRYIGTPTPSAAIQAAFETARLRLEQIVLSELPDQPLVNVSVDNCTLGSGTLNETVDDMIIFVSLVPIDGALGVNAQSGPCALRIDRPFTPYLGKVQLDQDDAARLLADGSLSAIALHEMLHTIGFGANWNVMAVLQDFGGANPLFVGQSARAQYVAAGGTAPVGVPVANVGPVGTRDAHWRESVFGAELMTSSYQTGSFNPLSAMTIGSLADIGYVVSFAAADPYTVAPPGQIIAGLRAPGVLPFADVVTMPMIFVDRLGHPIRPH